MNQKTIEYNLEGANRVIEFDKSTLSDQGHRDTGRLEKSLRATVRVSGSRILIEFFGLKYGKGLSTGLKPSEISFNYSDLLAWARRRKPESTDGELNRFLSNTIALWEKKGQPTEGSLKFSKTGERTGWIPIGTKFAEANFDELFTIDPFLEEIVDEGLKQLATA